MFLSVSARILLNNESLNMVESIGNFVRHRRAPIVVLDKGKETIKYVPAISGESIAHAYQEILARLALGQKLNVCDNCRNGYFIKHSDDKIFEEWASKAKDGGELEKEVIAHCVVEDIGGFLYAGKTPVKRTSRFSVGYMIPCLDAVWSSAIEGQFHVRYAEKKEQQSIFINEVGSAIYSFGFNIDLGNIGVSSLNASKVIGEDELGKRRELAVKALSQLLSNLDFGGKRSRFNPNGEVLSAVVVISKPYIITASPPNYRSYICDTLLKVSKAVKVMNSGNTMTKEEVRMVYYDSGKEELCKIGEREEGVKEVVKASNLPELFEKVINVLSGQPNE